MFRRNLQLPASGEETFFLWGPRQIGKTTLLKQCYPDARWLDLLKADEFRRYAANPELLRQEIDAAGQRSGQVVIDEVQKVPALLDEVHWLIENRGVQFALCGSSARKVRRGGANLLGGRAARFELLGLTAAELGAEFNLTRLLNQGYLPRMYQAERPGRRLDAYIDSYLKEEVVAEGLTRNLPAFAGFLGAAALTDGEIVNFSNVAADCAVSSPTAKGYFGILEDTLLGRWLPAYRWRSKRKLVAAPKFYFADVGVVNRLARRGPLAPGSELYGKAFENWVFHELSAFLAYGERDDALAYWRLAGGGAEVDFIVGDMRLAVEAKASANVGGRHLKGLRSLAKDNPHVGQRVVACLETRPRRTEDGIDILPVADFARRLWQGELLPVAMAALMTVGLAFGTVAEPLEGQNVSVHERGWPAGWFQAPKTASEAGIARFNESPYFASHPAHSELPPVAERLPDDPPVVVPYRGIGEYGGSARIVLTDLPQFVPSESALTISADMRGFLPNLAESWQISEDGRVITLRLRRGIRWSDGEPLTSDDFVFSFNDLWLNEEWAPVTSRRVLGGRIEKLDDRTFRYVFAKPNPLFVNLIAQFGDYFVDPEHYFRNFHPKYVDADELEARVRARGFITWMAWLGALRGWSIEQSAEVPTLRPYRVLSRSIQLLRLERNPYYFKVDPAGNQLPYIDRVDAEVVETQEVVTARAANGQLDFAAFDLRTQDIPLLKLGERSRLVQVHIWNRLHASDVAIQPNYNHPDARLRQLYQDKRFRQALSLAIDREEMNKIIYFGRGVPRQVTAHPSSSYFEPEFATAYAGYDPDRARALLHEVGLGDADGDGLLDFPDGSPLTITLEYIDFETPKAISMDLVRAYWRAVGIDLRLKIVDNSLQSARAEAGTMEMTLWHADRVTDILLPVEPWWWAPVTTGWEMCMWNDWARSFLTADRPEAERLGVAPPPHIRQLQRMAEEIRTTTSQERRIELAKALLRTNAENLWTIGTIGLAPQPVAVSRRLKNVIPNGIWGWDNRWTLSYHPPTWYLANDG